MAKLIYVLLDGVGDRPDPVLNDLTPLEAASTPSLDMLARKGSLGSVYPVDKGVSPESDIAVFCMLGYDLSSNYFGRGVVEAVGVGMDFREGDLALRANFATLSREGIVIDRRAGRDVTREESAELSEALNRLRLSHGAEFQFIPTVSHRAVLKIRMEGRRLHSEITNTDPAYRRVGGMGVAEETKSKLYLKKSTPLNGSDGSRLAADLVNEFTEKAIPVLENHRVNLSRVKSGRKPANVVLLRDAGSTLPDLEKISDRFGIRFASILDMPVEKGVSKITGMEGYEGGGIDDYEAKAGKTLDLLKRYDGVYIHLKGPDEPGHDGDARRKKKVIEKIDAEFFNSLTRQVDLNSVTFIVSADHSTPCSVKGHSADPVPLLISGPKVKRDATCRFTERDASRGSLGTMRGVDVLPTALSYL